MLRLSEALDYGTIATKREAPHHLALPVGRGEVSRAVAPPGSKNPGKAFPFQNLGKFTQGLPQHVVLSIGIGPAPRKGRPPQKAGSAGGRDQEAPAEGVGSPLGVVFHGLRVQPPWVSGGPQGADNHRQPPETDFAAPGGSTWG